METIAEKIKKIRKAKGLSLMALANTLDVSDTALSKIETGKTKSITIELGKAIAKALDVSFYELFDVDVPNNLAEIEELKNKISDLKKDVKLRDKIIADYSKMLLLLSSQ